ncbi:MAG: NAD-dependent epimerase [Omnitrophica WOR_2 bacterium RIFCSPLOWO2_12_FULL_51_8]|nr:MAG: NAD-dependent epimerase [Omnitrophica WOR_2 bacterium RIFCSPLOWO2_12_FULL_51_8]
MVVGDIMNLDEVISASKGCKYVYNFAGIADINDAKNRPVDTARINVLGNVHVLEGARISQVERFVFASSLYVYSESGSFYRASKQAAERFVESYHERYGLPYTILRYGSLYGRRADERNGIYRLLREALESKAVTYMGSKDAMREYIHVVDAAKLSVQILEAQYANRHFVLSGQERMTVENFMKMISEMIPGGVKLSFQGKVDDGHYIMTPYGFHPKVGHKLVSNDYVDLGQGLLDCMAEIHEQIHNRQHADGDWLVDNDETKG